MTTLLRNNMTMKKCPKCGFEIADDANYCSNCGLALKDPMPEIQYFNENEPQSIPDDSAEIEQPITSNSEPIVDVDDDSMAVNDEEANEVNDMEQSSNLVNEEAELQEDVKILGLTEGVFYTLLLAIGIGAVVLFKWYNDPQWLSGFYSEPQSLVTDTVKVDSVLNDSISAAVTADSVSIQSGAPTDSAFHVIITSLKDKAKAQEVATTVKNLGAYVISDDKIHKVAVYRSHKREDAQLYMDSVVKKDHPDAWIFHGTAK